MQVPLYVGQCQGLVAVTCTSSVIFPYRLLMLLGNPPAVVSGPATSGTSSRLSSAKSPLPPLPWKHKMISQQVKGCSRLETSSSRACCNPVPAAFAWKMFAYSGRASSQECCSAQGGRACTKPAFKALITRPERCWQVQQLFFMLYKCIFMLRAQPQRLRSGEDVGQDKG